MYSSVKLSFLDGELVDCSVDRSASRKLVLVQGTACDIDLVFCEADGSPLDLTFTGKIVKVQILLSKLDRMLAAAEQTAQWRRDDCGFFILPLKALVFDSPETEQVLAASYWELEPNYHGRVPCELAVAISVMEIPNYNMQLFFSINAVIKR